MLSPNDFIGYRLMKQKGTKGNKPADCHHDNIIVNFLILSHAYCAEEMLYGDVLMITVAFPLRTLLAHYYQIF